MLDSAQDAPDQAAPPKPTTDDLLGPREDHHEAAGALPTTEDLLGKKPPPDRNDEPQRRAAGILGPMKGAVAPGPFGDWLFGSAQHSSLARIMHAFGATVSQDVSENLPMSEDTKKYLREKGVFNDYVAGQASLLKSNAETLLRSGAVVVNGAIYGVPAVIHGAQEAVIEAGEQAQGTAIGQAVGARGLARTVAAVPEAFPTLEHPNLARAGGTAAPSAASAKSSGISINFPSHREFTPPVPEALATARDLNVIGPGGEAAWKGIAPVEHEEPVVATPAEVAPAEPVAPAPQAIEATPTGRSLAEQKTAIAEDVTSQLIAAGRPRDEAEASGALIANRFATRAETFNGALGTPEELYARTGAEIRRMQAIRQKVASSPAAARALDDFQERMEAGRDAARKRANEGRSAPQFASSEERDQAEARASTPQAAWDGLMAQRQERTASKPIETGYNPTTTKGGAAVRAKASQVWEPGNTVDVGFVKNLLVAEQHPDGSFTLLAKPDKDGLSQSYNAAPQKGLVREEKLPFLDKTRRIREPTPEESWRDAQEDALEALEPEERAQAKEDMGLLTQDDLDFMAGDEFFQKARGSITFRPNERPLMKLAKDANASTFIHESGHQFLEELMGDAEHEKAPDALKTDAKTVMDWLGVSDREGIETKHHEKFARGFEQYLREGVAPSPELAGVFARFKQWLVGIYQTIKGLGQPINEDIRGVFDRMLATEPKRTEAEPSFADAHEAKAEATPPERAYDVAKEIEAETDTHAAQNLVKEDHARFTDDGRGAEEGARESAPSPDHEDGARPQPGEPGNAGQARAVAEGGGEAPGASLGAPEGPGPSVKTEPPGSGNAQFSPSDSRLTDKIGNFRIDGLNAPEQILAAMRENIEKRDGIVDLHRRGVPATGGDLFNLGAASGLNPAWLDAKKIGDAYSRREILALEEMLVTADSAIRDAAVAAESGAPDGILAQAEAMARLEMLQAHIAGASAEWGRAGGAIRQTVKKAWGDGRPTKTAEEAAQSLARVKALSAQKWESPEALSAALKAETGRTLFQIQEMAQFTKNLTTPGGIARFVHDTADGKIRQAIVFYYVNALLSGPITHLKYAIGNQVTAMWAPLRTATAAGVDFASYHAGLQNERRIFLGEAGAEMFAMSRGFTEGIRAGKEGWRLGTTPDLPGESTASLFGAQPIINPIPGKIGYAIGLPGKGVGAVHGFGAAMRYRQEINKLAYRTAAQERLRGDAFTSRVAELVDRPSPETMEAASAVARSDLYMAPVNYNSFTANLQRVGDSNILAKVILPFVKIGIQIERKALENSPFAPFLRDVRENLSGANGVEARNTQIASMVAGTGLMAATATYAANGGLTGHGPHDKAKRDTWLALHQPYTVAIGDIKLNYSRWGYLGKLMAIAANAYETHQGWGDEEGHSIASAYYQGFQEALFDDSFLRSVKDFIDAKEDPDRYGARFVSNMLLNWEPMSVGMGQVARMVDPYQRETHTSSDAFLDTLFKEAWNKTPFLSTGLYPKRDVFGEPIRSGEPNPDYANDPTVRLLDNLHIGIGNLHDQITGVKLTDHQYDDYARVAGRTVKMSLDSLTRTLGPISDDPQARVHLIDQVHHRVTAAREQAAKAIKQHAYGSENDIVKQATEAKKIKKGISPAH